MDQRADCDLQRITAACLKAVSNIKQKDKIAIKKDFISNYFRLVSRLQTTLSIRFLLYVVLVKTDEEYVGGLNH